MAARHGDAQADRRGRRRARRARLRASGSTSPTTARTRTSMPSDAGQQGPDPHRAPDRRCFEADAIGVTPGDKLHTAFGQFMATASAYGFLSHCECRLSFNNHGPYKTSGGNEMLVRDLRRPRRVRLPVDGRGGRRDRVQQPDDPGDHEGHPLPHRGRLGQLRGHAVSYDDDNITALGRLHLRLPLRRLHPGPHGLAPTSWPTTSTTMREKMAEATAEHVEDDGRLVAASR